MTTVELLAELEKRVTVIEEALFGPAGPDPSSFSFTKEVDPLEARHFQVAARAKAFLVGDDD